jgi:hypothetical protein
MLKGFDLICQQDPGDSRYCRSSRPQLRVLVRCEGFKDDSRDDRRRGFAKGLGEDDLDSAFIFSSVVRTLRYIKERRQVVFIVTHSANIAVLGDSEIIFR